MAHGWRVTLNVVFGFVRSSNFPTEVLVVGLHLTDVGPGACGVRGARDGGQLDLVQVLVPIRSHVPRGAESPKETVKVG